MMDLPPHLSPYEADFMLAGDIYGLDPYLLAAICEVESFGGQRLSPPGPAGTGDGGRALGLMGINRQTFPEFYRSGKWRDPTLNILKGASILKANVVSFAYAGDKALYYANCAYNCGASKVRKALIEGKSAESYTAGGRYATSTAKATAALKSRARACHGPERGGLGTHGGGSRISDRRACALSGIRRVALVPGAPARVLY